MMGVNKAGASDCALTMAPCGGRMSGMNPVTYKAGETITVTIQKNLDHWVKATPGNFKISLMMDGSSTPMASAMINDMGEPSLTLYSTTLMVPMSAMKGKYMIQAVYNTMNPMAPPMFYQCADVMIMK